MQKPTTEHLALNDPVPPPSEEQIRVVKTLILPEVTPIVINLDEVDEDCPNGLEAFSKPQRTLTVVRRAENTINLDTEDVLEAYSQFDVKDSRNNQLFIAVEKTSRRSLQLFRDARLFNVTLYNRDAVPVVNVTRKLTPIYIFAQYICCCFVTGFNGCGNDATVTLCSDGEVLGNISQSFNMSDLIFNVTDEDDNVIFTMAGDPKDGLYDIYECDNPDEDPDVVAMIETDMTLLEVRKFYNESEKVQPNLYGVTFFRFPLPPAKKALIISIVILLDYTLCKPSTDYPHWIQFIPRDFNVSESTRQQVFRDDSREVIVTSLRPRRTERSSILEHQRCGYCIWLWSCLCMCCPLAVTRNALRCVLLAIFLVVLMIIVVVALSQPPTENETSTMQPETTTYNVSTFILKVNHSSLL